MQVRSCGLATVCSGALDLDAGGLDLGSYTDYCMKPFTGLDASLLLELQNMIKNVNLYAHKYLQVAEHIAENPAVDIKLVLRSPGKCVDQ